MITNNVLNQNTLNQSIYQVAKANQNEIMKENTSSTKPEKTTSFLKEPNKGNKVDYNV